MRTPALLMALMLATAPTAAMHKCKLPNGKTVFQDVPCAHGAGEKIEVRPVGGKAPAAPVASAAAGAGAAGATKTRAEQLREEREQLQNRNRLRDLEVMIPNTRRAIAAHERQCDKEIEALRRKQPYANDNLAGATWLQSLATEMDAISTRCSVRQQQLNADLQRLMDEKDRLKRGRAADT